MRLVFFTHPQFMKSQSMPRYARLVSEGMESFGHKVVIWSPKAVFYNIPSPAFVKKWLGYIDQYIVFPLVVKMRLKSIESDALFVFTDQALGPWVPLVKDRPHVIHCHDFLAQRSALGEIKENPIKRTGKLYQKYICHGYKQGRNFISVSNNTKEDLHRFLSVTKPAKRSEVIYNGLNQDFKLQNSTICRQILRTHVGKDIAKGYILHVGGNQWYKNRLGVINIYDRWRTKYPTSVLPLLLVGVQPSESLVRASEASQYKNDIVFLTNLTDTDVQTAYGGASVFLFPSLAEGFGWPIAEAMASGCIVLTTNHAPMTEVGGEAAFFLPVKKESQQDEWLNSCAEILQNALEVSDDEREGIKRRGFIQIQKFNTENMLKKIEHLYTQILISDKIND